MEQRGVQLTCKFCRGKFLVITTMHIPDPELVDYTCPECAKERNARIPKSDKPISLAAYREHKKKKGN